MTESRYHNKALKIRVILTICRKNTCIRAQSHRNWTNADSSIKENLP